MKPQATPAVTCIDLLDDVKFHELKPQMTGNGELNELTFECPQCRRRIAVRCRMYGPANRAQAIWLWRGDVGIGWDSFTLEPSISNHPVARNEQLCPAHFSITKGEVV